MKIKHNLYIKNQKQNRYKKYESFFLINKLICNNKIISINDRNQKSNLLIASINYFNKQRKLCIITNRMRGNVTDYRLNRMQFKLHIKNNNIPGITQSSW